MYRKYDPVHAILAVILTCMLLPSITSGQVSDSNAWAATVADQYEVIPNITYLTADNWDGKLDLYLPANRKEKNPTLIWIHGGGWTRSSKEQEVLYIMPYLEMGWAVVNVEYRLAHVSLAPAAVEDCRCALRWVVANAREYKFDTSKLVVSGISAGGHLALTTGTLPASAGLDRQCPGGEDSRAAAIINWFGPSDVAELVEGAHAFDQAVSWLGGRPDRVEVAKLVSPLTHVRQGLPPVITIHGDQDEVIPYDQSVRLHRALEKAGVSNRLVTIRGRGHGDFRREEWLRAYAAIREFLVKNGVMSRK